MSIKERVIALMKEGADVKKTEPVDIKTIFEGADFDKELLDKVSIMFEASVIERTQAEIKVIEEAVEKALEEHKANVDNEYKNYIETFVESTVNKYIEDNKLALEQGVVVAETENFINKFKALFIESGIGLPEEDLTLLQKKTDEVASLNARLSASINEKVELAQKIDNLEKEKIVKSVSEGLSEPQKDRLASIVESIKYENLVEFEEKTKTIRDTIVATKTEQTPVTNTTAHVVQESVEFKVDNQTHIINKTTESTVSLGKSLVDSMYSKKK